LKYDAFRNWRLNGICANLVHHPPATSSARSVTGCVVHGSGFLPTSPTCDDETRRRIDGSVHILVAYILHVNLKHCYPESVMH